MDNQNYTVGHSEAANRRELTTVFKADTTSIMQGIEVVERYNALLREAIALSRIIGIRLDFSGSPVRGEPDG